MMYDNLSMIRANSVIFLTLMGQLGRAMCACWPVFVLLVSGCGEKKDTLPQAGASDESGDWKTHEWPMTRGERSLQGRVHDRVPRQPLIEWTFVIKGAVTSEAAISNGLVVFGTDDGWVLGIEMKTGKERWRVATKDRVEAAPAMSSARVFAGSNDGVFRAIDPQSGAQVWQIDGQDKFPSGGILTRSPDGKEDWILVNGYDGVTRCLRTFDGREVWKHESPDYINGSPAIMNGGMIAFGGCDSVIHVIRFNDGRGLNKLATEAQIIRSLATCDSSVYGVNYANQLVAAEVTSAKLTWVYDGDGAAFLSSPAVDDARVYVGSRDKHLHAVDRVSGKMLWKFRTGGRVESAPLVFDDAVVFGSSDGRLYAVNPENGGEIWRMDLGENLAVAAAFADGKIVIGGGDGTLFVIKGGEKK